MFHADDEGTKFYVVLLGSVAVLRPEGRVEGQRVYQQLAVLKAGSSFGELALIQHASRVASIMCREPTALGVLGRLDYLRILGKAQEAILSRKVDLLQQHPIFTHWSRHSLAKLTYFFHEKIFTRKQVLYRAGEPATAVYLIKTGDLQLVKDISVEIHKNPVKEREKTHFQVEITLVSTGELLGGIEVIKQIPHRYTCFCASTQAEVLCISQDDFLKRMNSEETVHTVISLSEAIEIRRNKRLERVSQREYESRNRQPLLYARSLSPETGVPSSVLHAKLELEAEVRDRWHIARNSPVMRKTDMPQLVGVVSASQPPSPIPSPKFGERTTFKSMRSWSQLMAVKFAPKVSRSPDPSPKRPINIHVHKLREMKPRHLHLKHALEGRFTHFESPSKAETLRSETASRLGMNVT